MSSVQIPNPNFDLSDASLADEVIVLPRNLWSGELPLECDLHLLQIQILLDCRTWWWRGRFDCLPAKLRELGVDPDCL